MDLLHSTTQINGHGSDLLDMLVTVPLRTPTGDHVSVTDGLHLVYVIDVDSTVEAGVEIVEH